MKKINLLILLSAIVGMLGAQDVTSMKMKNTKKQAHQSQFSSLPVALNHSSIHTKGSENPAVPHYTFAVEGKTTTDDPAPVELMDFMAYSLDNKVMLEWETSSEVTNALFDVERSMDGESFESIGNLEGQGGSDINMRYSYSDNNPCAGGNYYRLKQMDNTGNFVYSPIRMANFIRKFSYRMYPNPARENITLEYFNSGYEKMNVDLVSVTGKLMKKVEQEVAVGNNEIKIDIEDLPAGVFLIRVYGQNYMDTFKALKE